MQGQKGKCKDNTKSDSLDRCEQVERSKIFSLRCLIRFFEWELYRYQIENAITLGGIGFFQFLTWAKWFTRELCSMGRHDECFFPFSKHPV